MVPPCEAPYTGQEMNMQRWTTMVASAALGLVLAYSAEAAELFTPGIEAGASSLGVTCLVRNVGKKPAEITLEIFAFNGNSAAGPSTMNLDPGAAAFLDDGGAAGSTSRYCVISGKFGKKSVRGSMYVRDADGNSIGTVQAE